MPITDTYARVPIEKIWVNRASRQRREVSTTGLRDSIAEIGVLSPIIITKDFELKAGECRWTSCKELISLGKTFANNGVDLTHLPCRFFESLDPIEARVVELEENSKRTDLSWRDEARAVTELHELYKTRDPLWSQVRTAANLAMSEANIAKYLRVGRELDNPKLREATGLQGAYNILERTQARAVQDAMSQIMQAGVVIAAPKLGASPALPGAPLIISTQAPIQRPTGLAAEDSLLNASFLEWAPLYSGPRFNLIHCDFPYGIDFNKGEWSGKNTNLMYDDSPDVYWNLIECLCTNLDRLMTPAGHLMFWFSMDYYCETLETFRQLAPSLAFQKFPLYWHKSDNAGIVPDPKRGPRRVMETAFIASREDRFVVKTVSNTYPAPTDKSHHPSTKPEPMLRHFFQMFCDENTRLLDPTCGSGTSVRAAESLGAEYVLGLEIDPEHHKAACSALRSFRVLRGMNR